MKTTLALLDDQRRKLPTRTVKVDVERLGWHINCAWCHVRPVKEVSEVVQHGFQTNLITTLCFCEECKKGTTVVWECKAETEEVI